MTTFLAGAAVFAGLAGVLTYALLRKKHSVEGWTRSTRPSSEMNEPDRQIYRALPDAGLPALERYRSLFDYFLAGFYTFRSEKGERVHYPGFKSMRGFEIEGLEGFARTAPLLAVWLHTGRTDNGHYQADGGPGINLKDLLKEGVVNGTDPQGPAYWGDIGDMDQRTVEAADVALTIWLSRDHVWAELGTKERSNVARWLSGVIHHEVSPNNWLLFRVLIVEVLGALGCDTDESNARASYDEFKELYLEHGWFYDPPMGVDFYNTWAITYTLFWIDRINPDFDPAFLGKVLRESADLTLHLISPDGVPLMGRSIGYRMAVPSPVIIGSLLDPGTFRPGQARRALDRVWRYFVARGALSQGCATQGYFGPDIRFVDRYIGPASCQWNVRSLILAFLHDDQADFWTAPEQPLPVEEADYLLELPRLGWRVEGVKATGEVTIAIPENTTITAIPENHAPWRQVVEFLFHKPQRPHNYLVKYGLRRYSSGKPAFCSNEKK